MNNLMQLILTIGDVFSGQSVLTWYKFYKKFEYCRYDELLDFQTFKLKILIRIAYDEVPMYRELYDNAGLKLDLLPTVEDLWRLPVVTKEDFKKYGEKNTIRSVKGPIQKCYTSGSSGEPFASMQDSISLSQSRALMILRANYSGWNIGDSVFQTGMTLNRGVVKKVKDKIFRTTYASAFDLSDNNLNNYLNTILQKKIKYLMGYPGGIYALAEMAEHKKLSIKLNGVVTWGDNLYSHYRKKIEKIFSCNVTDTYGCGEGIQVAAQCNEFGSYHIFMPHVVVEVVDENGFPVPRGDIGKIVLTKLEPGAMPLIRYSVGDMGRLAPNHRCRCGRGFDVLEKIEGRDSDLILTPNGNRLIVHFFTGIFEYYPQIKRFLVVQKSINTLKIYVDFVDNVNTEILKKIELEIKEKGDQQLIVQFDCESGVRYCSHKRKFVVSEIL